MSVSLAGVVPRDQLGRVGPFKDKLVANRHIVFDLKSVYGLTYRDIVTTEGSGAVTHGNGLYKLATTASGADSAMLDSAEPGRYQAGAAAQAGIGMMRPTAPVGDQELLWGYFDDQNGLAFGENAQGPFILRRSGGVDATKRQQGEWNVDRMNGAGGRENPSGLNLDLAAGQIFHIEFPYYGFGPIEWQALVVDGNVIQQVVAVHREKVHGALSLQNPNLPIRARADNAGQATALEMFVAGRQFSILGDYNPDRRVTSQTRENVTVGDTVIPLVSLRRKAEFPSGLNNHVSVKIRDFSLLTDNDLVYEVRTGAALTGASAQTPTNHDAANTALEADISATAISGGDVLYSDLAKGGTGNKPDITKDDFRFDFRDTEWVSLCARKRSGATDASVTATLRAREEF